MADIFEMNSSESSQLEGLLDVCRDEIAADDVAQLKAGVRGRIQAVERRQTVLVRFGALAAMMVFAFAIFGLRPPTTSVDVVEPAPVFKLAQNGALQINFADGEEHVLTRTVADSAAALGETDNDSQILVGDSFVDDAEVAPGSVAFYRID